MLKEDYHSQKNSALRKWFEVIDFNLRGQIKKEWIADMERLHVSILFFLWFPTFTSKYGLPEVYSQPNIDGVSSIATPFRKGREGDGTATYSHVQKIHQQLNYTNTAISTIATQLNQSN